MLSLADVDLFIIIHAGRIIIKNIIW